MRGGRTRNVVLAGVVAVTGAPLISQAQVPSPPAATVRQSASQARWMPDVAARLDKLRDDAARASSPESQTASSWWSVASRAPRRRP